MTQPTWFVPRPDPDPDPPVEAIKYTGEPDNIHTITEWLAGGVELVPGDRKWLIVNTKPGQKVGIASPGQWLVREGEGTHVWAQDAHAFEEYYEATQ